MLRKVWHFVGRRYHAIEWLSKEFSLMIHHLGSSNTNKCQEKIKAQLIIESHIIEKGLSLRDVKVGFGVSRVLHLLDVLEDYNYKFKDQKILSFVLSLVEIYIKFNKDNGEESSKIINKYNTLKKYLNTSEFEYLFGGVKDIAREVIYNNSLINYSGFVKSRFSIRNFTGEKVNEELVYKALEIARYTPSACNRQPWGNYVFFNKNKILELLDFQTGARQFKNDITCLILTISNYNSFFGGEYHQPYVNGGMYAMNLIFALHSMGLGTIPLNMGFEYLKLKKLKEICEIKDNEVPIMMIGVGVIPEMLKVAHSKRFDYIDYTKIYY